MAKGWISVHRELQEHWLWQEKREFSKLEAWLDILLTVNHSEQKTMIKNTLFTVNRGESINSLETWAKRWNWNKSKVRRFLFLLENDSMIVTKSEQKTTRLTVCKYDSYQDLRNGSETEMKQKRNASETELTPNNNDNNINKENKENNTQKQKVFDENKFNEFWKVYSKHKDYHSCKARFYELEEDEVNKILLVVKDYVNSTPDVRYRKNPLKWLEGKCWEDEIIKPIVVEKKAKPMSF